MSALTAFLESHTGKGNRVDGFSIDKLQSLAGMKSLVHKKGQAPFDYHDACRFIELFFGAYLNLAVKQELVRRDQASGGGFAVHGVQILTSRPTSNESYASSNALDFNGVSFDALRSAVETVLVPIMLNTAQSTMLDREDPTDQADTETLHGQSMFRDAGLIMEGRDAVNCGDYGRYLMWLKLTLPRWATARKHNYMKAILNFLVQLKHETTPAHRLYLLSSLFVSTNGNTLIGYDLALERATRIIKDTFPPHGGRASVEHMAMIGSNVYPFAAIQVSLRDGYRIASLDERHALAEL